MDFDLAEHHVNIKALARAFAERTVRPRAREIDRTSEWPADIVRGLSEIGLLGLRYPQEYGGVGADYSSYVLAIEELSRVSVAVGAIVQSSILAEEIIFAFGTEEQKRRHLEPLLKGRHMGTLAFTEAGTGSDPKAITTVAKLKGDSYLLSGEKTFGTLAPAAKIAVIFAKDETGRVSTFIVDTGAPGFKVGKHWDTLGLRGSGTCPLYLSDVPVPKDGLLGEKGKGYDMLLHTIGVGRLGICAGALGAGQAALELSIDYAKNRIVRNAPMANLPTVQVELAEMATKIEAARCLTYRSAWLKDQGKDIRKEVAMAKLFSSEAAVHCTSLGMQIHGSYGYCKDYDIERFYRDAKVFPILEGVSEMLSMIIAQSILRE